jgi:excisionase family DNA binding protein
MDKLLKIKEVAEILGVSKSTVYNMVHRGELPAVGIRGGMRVSAAALRKWMDDLPKK